MWPRSELARPFSRATAEIGNWRILCCATSFAEVAQSSGRLDHPTLLESIVEVYVEAGLSKFLRQKNAPRATFIE